MGVRSAADQLIWSLTGGVALLSLVLRRQQLVCGITLGSGLGNGPHQVVLTDAELTSSEEKRHPLGWRVHYGAGRLNLMSRYSWIPVANWLKLVEIMPSGFGVRLPHKSSESLSMDDRDLLAHTTTIISSWTAANRSTSDDLLSAIRVVHQTLCVLASGQETAIEIEPQRPAVSIKKSVTPDYIVCLEDGRKLKMLKRYLRTTYDMTPEQYRAKWGLPSDYPMVAPNYSASRAKLARKIGLGRKPKPVEPPAAKAATKRGRRKKAAA